MEEKRKFIDRICKKQNFEEILLRIKLSNKKIIMKNILKSIENIKEIEDIQKRKIYEELYNYIDYMNKCHEKNLKNVFILGIEETLKEVYKKCGVEKIKLKNRKEEKEMKEIIEKIKTNGIIRRLDELGRIVIPIEYRHNKIVDGKTKVKIDNIEDFVVVEILEDNIKTFTRRFDDLGRIVVPAEIRDRLNWQKKDEIEIWEYGKYLILQKTKKECVFCGNKKNLIKYKKEMICQKCKEDLINIK